MTCLLRFTAAIVIVTVGPLVVFAGDGAVRLTSHPAHDYNPAWSPDGTQIAFMSMRSGNADIWVIPSTGGIPTQITFDPASDNAPRWSPDGSQIVFNSNRSGNGDIWVIPATGGVPTQVTFHPEGENWPSWSPDGTQIAFMSLRGGNRDIWVIPSTGGVATQLTFDAAVDQGPFWSPTGDLIAFQSERSGNADVWVVSANGGAARQITFDPNYSGYPAWSPTGAEVSYRWPHAGTTPDIWAIPITGGTPRRITSHPVPDRGPATWSPDGRWVAFWNYRSGNADIWLIEDPDPPTASGLLADLTSSVAILDLPAGIEHSLLAKLDAAGRAIDRGNGNAASQILRAFANQVAAQRGHYIREVDAATMIQVAGAIRTMLSGDDGPILGGGKWQPVLKSPNDEGGIQLAASQPNPFSRSTTVSFALPQPSAVNITVYDVAGRLIRTLLEDERPQGHHTAAWGGRDAAGLRVTAGTYFVRLTAGDITRTRKVVFLGGH